MSSGLNLNADRGRRHAVDEDTGRQLHGIRPHTDGLETLVGAGEIEMGDQAREIQAVHQPGMPSQLNFECIRR